MKMVADRRAREGRQRDRVDWHNEWGYERRTRRKSMEERMMQLWQIKWDASVKGRELCREVVNDCLPVRFKAGQLVTGHGNFPAYLHRFGLMRGSTVCECGRRDESAKHIREECGLEGRQDARERVRHIWSGFRSQLRVEGKVNDRAIELVNEWAERVVMDGQR
ncbi:unnamed protein product [Acanthoscelides obtectus]|uniref:Reverse transcriptase n=1 Tax=Acanthoscelides obtectus TaxID=200917 RepID=A0A9P0M0F0_ACAOB|nr:unnamed protein product [Acanthoscelides obtectus]CAK1682323.1 hypothetical protein AOBTE_LOCUS33568 [Acanthoscelides obtectus]